MYIIALLIVFIIGVINHLNPKDHEGFQRCIRYDLKDQKRAFRVTISVTIIEILALLGCLFGGKIGNWLSDACMVLTIFGWLPVLLLWGDYIQAVFYLKRLRRNGFEVPERKTDFDKRINMLKRTVPGKEKTDAVTWDSVILAVVSWMIAAGIFVRALFFWRQYQAIQDAVTFCLFVFGLIIVCWIVAGRCYWIQRQNSKYRDDVDIYSEHKIRVNLVSGIWFILLMAILCNIGILFMDNGIKYVIKAREEAQIAQQHEKYYLGLETNNEGTEI